MYKLDFSYEGKASLALLDKEIGQRVLDKLKWLIQNIETIQLLPLRVLQKIMASNILIMDCITTGGSSTGVRFTDETATPKSNENKNLLAKSAGMKYG